MTSGKNITLLRDAMNAAIAYGLALEKAKDARDTLEGFLNTCRETGADVATVETMLSFVTATEEDHLLAPGILAEEWAKGDEERTEQGPVAHREPQVHVTLHIDPEWGPAGLASSLLARAILDLRDYAERLETHGLKNIVADGELGSCAWTDAGRLEANFDLRDPRDEVWTN